MYLQTNCLWACSICLQRVLYDLINYNSAYVYDAISGPFYYPFLLNKVMQDLHIGLNWHIHSTAWYTVDKYHACIDTRDIDHWRPGTEGQYVWRLTKVSCAGSRIRPRDNSCPELLYAWSSEFWMHSIYYYVICLSQVCLKYFLRTDP